MLSVRQRYITLLGAFLLLIPALMFATGGQEGTGAKSSLDESRLVPGFTILSTTAEYSLWGFEASRMQQEAWSKLGLDVKVETVEWSKMTDQVMTKHVYDAGMIRFSGRAERYDPHFWVYSFFHSSQDIEGGYDISKYKNPEYDALAEEQMRTLDIQARKDIVFKLQEITARDQPLIPFAHIDDYRAYNSDRFETKVVMPGALVNNNWFYGDIKPKTSVTDLKFGYNSDITLLNPLSSVAFLDAIALRLVYDTLFRIGLGGSIEPWAALSMKKIDDLTFDVTLRPGMKWHDGKPLTAEDVKFTYDFVKQVQAPYSAWRVEQLESVTIISENVVRFKLSEPFAPFIHYGLASVDLLPKHIWEPKYKELGAEILSWANQPMVGSGPFKFEYWRRDQESKLSANASHFQPPKITSLILVTYASASALVDGLVAGDIDVSGQPLTAPQLKRVKETPHLKVLAAPNPGYFAIFLNTQKAPLDRVEVRRALAAATPKKAFVEIVLEGLGAPAYSSIGEPIAFWHNPNVEKLGDDIEKARKILKDAKYEWDAQGRLYYPPK